MKYMLYLICAAIVSYAAFTTQPDRKHTSTVQYIAIAIVGLIWPMTLLIIAYMTLMED